jgi:hypothetical protein
MPKLIPRGVLEELWQNGSDTKFAMGDKEGAIAEAKASLRKIIKEEMPKEKPLYGGKKERALNLPPDIECSNTGYNQALTDISAILDKLFGG